MKRKIFVAISVTLFLTATLLMVFPAKSAFVGTIKIGVVGPMPWIQGAGIAEGVRLAAKEINAAGGIVTTETYTSGGQTGVAGAWQIEVISADTLRGMPDPTTATGTAAGMELAAAGCDYVIGGFRTEATYGIREVLMDSADDNDKPIYIITGSATNQLIDDGTGADPATVRSDYHRYRYLFRATPMNSTMLFYGIAGYLKYVMASKLMPIVTGYYLKPLPIAVISEDLTWADIMHLYLSNPLFWNVSMGMSAYGGVDVVYTARVGPVATDVSAELLAAQAAGARLILEVLSGPVGRTMAIQFADLGIKAILSGVDVPGQEIPLHWTATAGKAEYESFLASAGTRTEVSPKHIAFWDAYELEYGHAPIYTSYGAYDTMWAIKEVVEGVGKWPMGARERVPYTEKTYRLHNRLGGPAMDATFLYTGPNPGNNGDYTDYDPDTAGNQSYSSFGGTLGPSGNLTYADINPLMTGTLHELYHTSAELTPVWYPPYYGRSLTSQWQKDPITGEGRLEVFYPMNMPFSKKFKIPPALYDHADTDISGSLGYPDGSVNVYDMDIATWTWLSSPGDAAWDAYGAYTFPGLAVDQDGNGVINIADVSAFGKEWGYDATDAPPDGYGTWPLG